MRTSPALGIAIPVLLVCALARCGGGSSSSGVITPPSQNPIPSLNSVSPSVIAVGASDTAVELTGTNFLPASTVSLNGSSLLTTFVSSTQLTATIPSGSLAQAGTDQITVSNPLPGGGTSAAQQVMVVAVGSLVIMATPKDGGPSNAPWQVSAAAADLTGKPIQGLIVSMNTSEGSLALSQGKTDTNGSVSTIVSPPASYSGGAVAVGATAGTQTAVINIAFVPSSFNPSAAARPRDSSRAASNASSATGTSTIPFVFGTSGAPGSNNPFLRPSLCHANVDLGTTIPAACEPIYANEGIVQKVVEDTNAVCKAAAVITDVAGAASCVGIVASVTACVTGVGAVICAGGLTYADILGDLCLVFLSDVLAHELAIEGADKDATDVISAGLQAGPPGVLDSIGLICDAVDAAAIGIGTGSSDTQVTIAPSRPTVLLGNSVQFTSTVSGNSNTAVTWSINGVAQGAGPYGTITADGLYKAPSIPPFPSKVTVSATSVADQSASAPAIVSVEANVAGTIVTVAGNGSSGYSGDLGPATEAQLSTPSGIAFDGGANMFIADSGNSVIRRTDGSTQVITTIAGTGAAGYSGDGGAGKKAELNLPTHVVFDRTVNLYITDANNERIRRVDALTDQITTIAGTGIAGFSGDGGPATNAQLNFPDGVALDSNDNLFIGDALNNRVRKVNFDTGKITTVAGDGIAGYSGDGGSALSAELNFPSRPAIDHIGNIYIADYQNQSVRRVDSATGIITTVAGSGVAGYSGDGGPATAAELNGPLSVALDGSGALYIADTSNQRIRAVNTSPDPITVLGSTIQPGEIVTVVGTGVTGYSGDGGPATSAEINLPTGLIVDRGGNLFFADAHNNVVRKVTNQ